MTRRRQLLTLALPALLAALLGAWRWHAGAEPALARLETALVDRGGVASKVTATGTLSAIVTVQVGSQVSGRIAALHADYNSKVSKGQLIARIDPELFQAAVEQARANLLAAKGNEAKARAQARDAARQLERSRELVDKKLVAQAEYDTAQANAEAAQAQVEASQGSSAQARAALRQAEVSLAYTRILSPTSGVVISRSVDVGQTVAASLQAPTLFTIAEDLAKMQVDTSVGEADVGRLRPGMPATFTVDAWPGEAFHGTVRQIRNSPQTVQNVVTYDAVIDVANPELELKPGMTANVTFVWAQRDGVVRVPNAALRFQPPSGAREFADPGPGASAPPVPASGPGSGSPPPAAPGQKTVWVLRGESPAPVRVRTGISDGSLSELVDGALQPGDRVVTDAAASTTDASPSSSQRRGMGPPPPP